MVIRRCLDMVDMVASAVLALDMANLPDHTLGIIERRISTRVGSRLNV
jgi:hypothetical protein